MGCNLDITDFPEQKEILGYEVQKLASYPIPADNYIFLYRIVDLRDGEQYYSTVNNKPYHVNGQYVRRLIYDVMGDADNSITAFRMFIEDAEQHAF